MGRLSVFEIQPRNLARQLLGWKLLLEQLCGVQLVPQTIGYRGSVITRSESASSRQETPIAASVAASGDNRHG